MSVQEITAKTIADFVIKKKKLFILDVRNESDFNDWKIEGKSIQILNKPYFDMLEGVDEIIDEIPRDIPILVVCAKEGSSKFVAEMLKESGIKDVMYLKGGMKAWSDHLEPIKVGDLSNGGSVYQFVRIGKGCLSYMIASEGEAIVIDAGRTIEPFITFAKEKGVTIKHAIDTHLHADHISGGRKLREETGAAYWLPPKDAEEVVFEFNGLTETSNLKLNGTQIDIIYSPGHTIGSTSILVDNEYLLTGDILFVQSIGRPDLAGRAGDWASHLRETLYSRYKEMSENLMVLPAHFSHITELGTDGSVSEKLGVLFTQNDGLQIEDESDFHKRVSENLPPQPNSFQEIRKTNMGKINPNEDEQQEMEIGPNRCAIN
ncbi:MBL fold metallo-hydrolase [Virgibacillus sp. W0430]|uniref:MBL fold metallo-hydrolase n=1 Tax=Virgibacillus sp. W0430 TaxID=3391580 RepID=UPI003F48A7D7